MELPFQLLCGLQIKPNLMRLLQINTSRPFKQSICSTLYQKSMCILLVKLANQSIAIYAEHTLNIHVYI